MLWRVSPSKNNCMEDENSDASQGPLTLLECGHKFHEQCLCQWEEIRGRPATCPQCREVLQRISPRRAAAAAAVSVGFNFARMWQGSELAEYSRFIRSLPTSDKLEPGHIFGGFPCVTGENALAFVTHWLQQRPCFPKTKRNKRRRWCRPLNKGG